jgi:ATP-dependent helicase/nuclease subunit A
MEQVEGEVRVLTVHSSKGLQAPILFLPDTTNTPPSRESIFWQGGVPLWSFDSAQDSQPIKQCKAVMKKATMQEYRRLHYVALTRAADELYIAGWQGANDISADSWYAHARQAMQSIAQEGEDGVLRVENHATKDPSASQKLAALPQEQAPVAAPACLLEMPTPELSRPSAEASLSQDMPAFGDNMRDQSRFRRGVAVHQLLEILPDLPPAQQQPVAEILLRQSMPDEGEAAHATLIKEVLAIIHDPAHAELFREGAQAEVTIRAMIDQQGRPTAFTGRIDRMVVLPERVLIVDYKTQRQIPDRPEQIPLAIHKQLQRYKAAISQLYPDRQVQTAILWTSGPCWMPVED